MTLSLIPILLDSIAFPIVTTHRTQRVVVSGEHSAWTDVVSGVPQGTVLGPLLFLTYINDLPDNLKSSVHLFADDCVLYKEIKDCKDSKGITE